MPIRRHLAFFGQIDKVIDAGFPESRQPRPRIRVIANGVFPRQQAAGYQPIAVRQRQVQGLKDSTGLHGAMRFGTTFLDRAMLTANSLRASAAAPILSAAAQIVLEPMFESGLSMPSALNAVTVK